MADWHLWQIQTLASDCQWRVLVRRRVLDLSSMRGGDAYDGLPRGTTKDQLVEGVLERKGDPAAL